MENRKIYCFLSVTFIMMLMVSLSSCSKSPVEECLKTMDDAIAKIEECDDIYELVGIANTLRSDLNTIDAANRDYNPTQEEAEQIQNKLNEFTRVYLQRTTELTMGNTSYGQQTQELLDKMLPQQK